MKRICFFIVGLSCLGNLRAAVGDKTSVEAEGSTFFRVHIRPVLVQQCLVCHGPDKKKRDLDLSRRESVLEGGATGPALVAGKAAELPFSSWCEGTNFFSKIV